MSNNIESVHVTNSLLLRLLSAVNFVLCICWTFVAGQKPLVEALQFLRSLQVSKLSTSLGVTQEEPKNVTEQKLLKVAIVGRPNAGKSTLINGILNLNVCGVSQKSHTTMSPFKAAFTRGDTQVVFVDTPGLVTRKESVRFNLPDKFMDWKESVLNEADIIGVIHEASDPREIFKFHINLTQNIHEFPESKSLFLIFSKIDLVLDKDALSEAINSCWKPGNLERADSSKQPKIWRRFSKIFFTSAVKNVGVNEVADYLLEQAKPGQWLFSPGQVFEEPIHLLIRDLLRSQLMDILPHEIPYKCKYEVEYLKENDLGEVLCVCLITCSCQRHSHLIVSGKKRSLRSISKQLEADLYKILGKVFRIRLVVRT